MHTAWALEDPVANRLIEQARYWQQRSREDLAADAWRKLLRADPNHPIALVQLGVIEARAGHFKEAAELQSRASRLTPLPAGISELDSALKVGAAAQPLLSNARKLVQTGQPKEALKSFSGVFGENKPVGQVGLEYYKALGSTPEGWDAARVGIEELARANPGDTRYLVALAQHLSYREPTRREAIRQLAALAEQDPEAKKAWREALVWLGARPTDRPLFVAYLKRYPEDQAVAERLRLLEKPADVYRPDPRELARQTAFKLLQFGDLQEAEKGFRSVLEKTPNDADSLGGLGTIRLRQEQFDEALNFLDAAIKADQRSPARWKQARDTAQYWFLIQDVLDARQAGQLADKESQLQRALKIDSKETVAQVLWADLLAQRHEVEQAERIYRSVLKVKPLEPGAFRGLIALLVQSDRDSEAMAMASSLSEAEALKIGGLNEAKAASLLKLAGTADQRRDFDSAVEHLEDALLLDPLNPWVRLALARQYQRRGDSGGANAMLDRLLDINPDMPDALHASALLLGEQQRWWEALVTLERIPAAARTAAIAKEQNRLWVMVQVQRATQFAAQGNLQQATALMSSVERTVEPMKDLPLLGIVAGGWSELGEPTRALRLARNVVANTPDNDLVARIQLAAVLLKARDYNEMPAVLRKLADSDQLTPAQQDDLNQIILVYTLHQVDTLREAGRLSEAYAVLNPALTQTDDSRLIMALARIYNSGGESQQALQLAEEVIVREPDDLEHRLFASGVALGARALDKAAGHAKVALELAPDHPRALAAAGRVEKVRGNSAKALEYFRHAQALEREKDAFAGVPDNLSLRLVEEELAENSAGELAESAKGLGGLLPIPDAVRGGGRLPILKIPAPAERSTPDSSLNPLRSPVRDPVPTSRAVPLPAPTPVPAKERSASDELADFYPKRSKSVDVGMGERNRSGEEGVNQLAETEVPLEARFPVGDEGIAILRMTPVVLSAGNLNLANPKVAVRFGSEALGAFIGAPAPETAQESQGVALSAAYRGERMAADIGITPLGFKASNLVGGVTLFGRVDDISVRGSVSSRAVTDSLLSYAGTRDPRSGVNWGGVVKSGGRLDLGFGDDDAGLYAGAAYSVLTGDGVRSNTELEGTLGAYWRVYQTPGLRATLGLNLTAMGYRENLGYYTLGQGGYFSPQRYLSLGFPMDIYGRRGNLSYQVGGDVGVRRFTQESSAYFPNDVALQTEWEQRLAATSGLAGYASSYASGNSSGVGYNLYGSFEYLFKHGVSFGGRVAFDNSRNYSQQAGILYVRYVFDELERQPALPPRTLRQLYLGDSQ